MAEYQAIIAVGNALFPFKRRVDYSSVPWATFTDPELAHLGLTEEEAKNKYKDIYRYILALHSPRSKPTDQLPAQKDKNKNDRDGSDD